MCGLAGVAGTIDKEDVAIFNQLMYMASFRGTDSTGVCVAPYMKRGQNAPVEVDVIKQVGSSFEFLDRQRVRDALTTGNALFMGHTRSRTFGDVNKQNAQPFEFDNIVGTHNGTLSYGAKYRLEPKNKMFPTDSAALYDHLDNFDIEGVLRNTDKDTDAMALVWFNKKKNQLHFYRNNHRPLFYALSQNGVTLYWASEAGMLYLALNRANVAFKKVSQVPENGHMVWSLPTQKNEKFNKPVLAIKKQQFKSPYAAVNTGGGQVRHFMFDQKGNPIDFQGNRVTGNGTTALTNVGAAQQAASFLMPEEPKEGTVIPFKKPEDMDPKWRMSRPTARAAKDGGPFYKSDNGRIYDKDAFEKKAFEGCAICGMMPEFGEPVKFLRDESICCSQCMARAKEGKGDQLTMDLLNSL